MSLTVDGWSGSIWSVQPWTGMMNTASSVNSCHQSRGRGDGPLTAARAGASRREGSWWEGWRQGGPGVASGGERGGGWDGMCGGVVETLECGSIRRAGVYASPCRAVQITMGRWSALMPTRWEGFIFHVRESPPPPLKDEHPASRQVMALHCLGRRSRRMKCARIPSVDVGRH